jgi:hypothetical protein
VTTWGALGAPIPDVNGDYKENGLYNGHMSYKRMDGSYYIWADTATFHSYMTTAVKGAYNVDLGNFFFAQSGIPTVTCNFYSAYFFYHIGWQGGITVAAI